MLGPKQNKKWNQEESWESGQGENAWVTLGDMPTKQPGGKGTTGIFPFWMNNCFQFGNSASNENREDSRWLKEREGNVNLEYFRKMFIVIKIK